MPELPEVETVVRDLRPFLVDHTITSVRQSKQKLRGPWKAAWNAEVAGSRIEAVRRRGKWILIDVAKADLTPQPPSLEGKGVGGLGSSCLRIHLGMSGQFTVVPASEPEKDHTHVVFSLDDGNELRFRDPRRFGSAEFFPDRAKLEAEMNAELGPEPFGIDADYFRDAVRATSRNLKALLLDQTIVAGVGNIYADESCFRAKLHPGRKGKSLSDGECDRLREAIEAVMTRAIESRGSTIRDYVGGSGLRGGFQNEFVVYGRTGEPCPTCGSAVQCERYAGRASHFCPACQRISPQRGSPLRGGKGRTKNAKKTGRESG